MASEHAPPGSTQPSDISLATIVKELKALRDQRATGTYYIVSADNRQVRFGIVNGEIAAMSIRTSNLAAALDAIAGLNIVRTSFAADGLSVSSTSGGLALDTDEICNELLRRAGHRIPLTSTPKAASQTPQAPRPAATSLSAAQHIVIRQVFIEYLGPIGDFIYEECRSANKPLDGLLADLAREIPDGRKAEQFLTQVRQRLK